MEIVWRVSPETKLKIDALTRDLHNRAITEAHWLDEVMRLPGYPIPGAPRQGDNLQIEVARPAFGQVPRSPLLS